MTPEEINQEIWEFIDEKVSDISKEDYLEVLQGLRDDSKIRIEMVEHELKDEND